MLAILIRLGLAWKSVSIDEREDYDCRRVSECWTSRPLEQLHGGPILFRTILFTPKRITEDKGSRDLESMEKAAAAVRLGAYGKQRKRCSLRVARLSWSDCPGESSLGALGWSKQLVMMVGRC